MRSNLSRTLAVAAAASLLPSAFIELTPGWAPVDYPLLGLVHPRSHPMWLSLATPLLLAALAAGVAVATHSRRPARFGAYLALGTVLHWFLLSPIQHGTFATDFSVGVWLALAGSALLAISAALPETQDSTSAAPGRLSPKDRASIATASAARNRAARSSVAWMLDQMSDPSRR